MCGRAYSTYTEEELFVRYLNEKGKRKPPKLPDFGPNYNLSPSQDALVLRIEDGKTKVDPFRWGLIPFWAKDMKIGYKMINARSETLAEKPSFRVAFKKRRCIIPLSGFIEWKREGEVKQPHRIFLKDEPIMSVAGIWETWKPEGSKAKELHSFAIVTTEANRFMAKIHDRMPVILDQKSEEQWLDPEYEDTEKLSKLFKPCPDKWLASFEISNLVNSPKNNRKEVLDRLANVK